MAMVQATLETALLTLVPTTSEASAITALGAAYETFALGAAAGPVGITAAGVAAGRAVMETTLVGMSATDAGRTKIAASIVAFWATAAVPASFPTSFVVVAPPNAALQGLLNATWDAAVAAGSSLADATMAMAADMYAQAIIGGSATIPPPPIIGTLFPII